MEKKVYAQVYSMIRTFPEGLLDALRLFSQVGYDGVELIGQNTEGLSVTEFKALLRELRLDPIAVHGLGATDDSTFAAEVGARYLSVESPEEDNVTRDGLLRFCEELNRQGECLHALGLKTLIHNHADEFRWVRGEEEKTRIYDVLIQNSDPELVGFEFDVGWAARAGVDVVDVVKRYPGRFPLIHVKECTAAAETPEGTEHFPKKIFNAGLERDASGVPILTEAMKQELYETRSWNGGLGTGIIDWKALRAAADAQGCEAYINEREYYHFPGSDGTNRDCVRLDYEFLRGL